ncbi:hypothetical protein 2 [Beihai mantis shrimp virus 4]|uniref:hypothetical protein 2 n=1 Tax=Beihai mantis shrimp virus 4 TaxID=1922431 RepID=UPI00090B843D|nr:hypothetical protein 2 [Beihai mantis shrimp virus 4]APG76918.1 hypothetical protein 2 [Beihai mantis shrimp virus 4]
MMREVITHTGIWSTSDPEVSTTIPDSKINSSYDQPYLEQVNLPDDVVRNSAFMANKAANIAYMRGNYCVTLRVQGTPFLQGVLWLWNKPNAQRTSTLRRSLTEHLRSITSFEGVRLNMQSVDRVVSLNVPFTSEFQVFNPRDVNTLNEIRVSVLSGLTGQKDMEKASYALTAKLTEVHFYGHAPSTTSQLPEVEGDDGSASERGIVSSVADTVASISSSVAGMGVPVLSSIAKPVSWVSKVVGNVASMFGFSKDRDMTKVTAFENLPAKGFTHGIGFDYGVPLSLFPDNAIDPTIAVPTDEDEMSIEYIARRPYMLDRYKIQGGDTPSPTGTIIMDLPISPTNFATYGKVMNEYRTIFGAPINLTAALAAWWRGILKLRLTFAKTQYHQCRLLVQYLPYSSGVQPLENVLSEIIDISKIGEEGVEISFPTIFRNKWLRTYDPAMQGFTEGCAAGRIVVSVLNELISAETVADHITMMPWITWENFELAEPGSLAKVAIGFKYPQDADDAEQAQFFKVPISQTYQFDRDTFMGPATIRGYTKWSLVGQESQGTFILFDDDGPHWVKLPQGTYRREIEIDGGENDLTLVTNYPFLQAPAGPEFFTSVVSNGDVVTSKEEFTAAFVESAGVSDTFNAFLVQGDISYPLMSYVKDMKSWSTSAFLIPKGKWQVRVSDPKVSIRIVSDHVLDVAPRVHPRFRCIFDEEDVSQASFHSIPLNPEVEGADFVEGDSSTLLTTMGEQFRSLRLLSRRATLMDNVSGVEVSLPGITLSTDTTLRQSVLNIISYMYRYTKGGISYKLIPRNVQGGLFVTTMSNDSVDKAKGAYVFDNNRAMHFIDTRINPIAQITLPFYSPAENLVIDTNSFPFLSNLSISSVDRSDNEFTVLVAAADDHSFSQLAGAPPFTFGPRITS